MSDEWIDYDLTMKLLRHGGFGALPSRILSQWAADGHVRAKAAVATYDEVIKHDELIDAEFFSANRMPLLGGSMEVRARDGDRRHSAHFARITFSKSDLLKILQHIPASEAEEVLADNGLQTMPRAAPFDYAQAVADLRRNIGDNSTAAPPSRTGDPGRPETSATLYLAEFHRRKERGEVRDTLASEAQALLDWLHCDHPSAPKPSIKTIKNRIRDLYREAIR